MRRESSFTFGWKKLQEYDLYAKHSSPDLIILSFTALNASAPTPRFSAELLNVKSSGICGT